MFGQGRPSTAAQGASESVVCETCGVASRAGAAGLLDLVSEDVVHPSLAVLEVQTTPTLCVLLWSESFQELRGEGRAQHELMLCVCVFVTNETSAH